jgi:TonB family protein
MKNRTLYLILFLFLITPSLVYGQEDINSLDNDLNLSGDSVDILKTVYCFPDCSFPIIAEFPDGQDSLLSYLKRTIIYPDSAKAMEISGTVYISFVVEEDGSIGRVKLLRGIGGGCDEAALEAIRNMPKWEPEKWRDVPTAAIMIIPIRFSLDKTDDKDSL